MKTHPNKIILWITTVLLFFVWIYALTLDSHYKWDFFFLLFLLSGVYYFRKELALHPLHYALLGIFLLLHDFGVFGWYELYPLGIEYDYWVHSYFGFVAALMLVRFYRHLKLYNKTMQIIAVIVVLLGMSALHELYEYGGALILGEGDGVLFIGAGDLDEWDTQQDMLNNMIGGFFGIFLYWTVRRLRPSSS